jgi:hypothetical protein
MFMGFRDRIVLVRLLLSKFDFPGDFVKLGGDFGADRRTVCWRFSIIMS